MSFAKDFSPTGSDPLLNQLLGQPEVQERFNEIKRQDELERRVSAEFQRLTELVVEAQNIQAMLLPQLDFYKSIAFAPSIFEEIRKNAFRGLQQVQAVAEKFSGAWLAHHIEPELRKLVAAHAQGAAAALERFKRDNVAILKKLGLI